jgi:hypothetical protein
VAELSPADGVDGSIDGPEEGSLDASAAEGSFDFEGPPGAVVDLEVFSGCPLTDGCDVGEGALLGFLEILDGAACGTEGGVHVIEAESREGGDAEVFEERSLGLIRRELVGGASCGGGAEDLSQLVRDPLEVGAPFVVDEKLCGFCADEFVE